MRSGGKSRNRGQLSVKRLEFVCIFKVTLWFKAVVFNGNRFNRPWTLPAAALPCTSLSRPLLLQWSAMSCGEAAATTPAAASSTHAKNERKIKSGNLVTHEIRLREAVGGILEWRRTTQSSLAHIFFLLIYYVIYKTFFYLQENSYKIDYSVHWYMI